MEIVKYDIYKTLHQLCIISSFLVQILYSVGKKLSDVATISVFYLVAQLCIKSNCTHALYTLSVCLIGTQISDISGTNKIHYLHLRITNLGLTLDSEIVNFNRMDIHPKRKLRKIQSIYFFQNSHLIEIFLIECVIFPQ